jgi:hypothetical protein
LPGNDGREPELSRVLVSDLDALLASHRNVLRRFRDVPIRQFGKGDRRAARNLFADFDELLGPVGAAKALHLLAPRFFPIWDSRIARAYGFRPLRGRSADAYVAFMEIVQQQVKALGGASAIGHNPLRKLDAFNYCRYTRGWL